MFDIHFIDCAQGWNAYMSCMRIAEYSSMFIISVTCHKCPIILQILQYGTFCDFLKIYDNLCGYLVFSESHDRPETGSSS